MKPADLPELRRGLLGGKPDFEEFKSNGPFAVTIRKDFSLRVAPGETISGDLYLSSPAKAPLVVILHGFDSTKEDHAQQALRVATWGMHGLAIQMPNRGRWSTNGRMLASLVEEIHRAPALLENRVDTDRIILVGHSFGASSVVVALAQRPPVAGAVLLDAAGIGRDLRSSLQQVGKPVLLLWADEQVSVTRNRDYFFEYIPAHVGEVSIRNAGHEDAQYRFEPAPPAAGADAAEEPQNTFASALTAAAFSLSATGGFDYAWASYGAGLDSGKLFNARKKE